MHCPPRVTTAAAGGRSSARVSPAASSRRHAAPGRGRTSRRAGLRRRPCRASIGQAKRGQLVERLEPDDVGGVVEDHRARLGDPELGGDEDEAGGRPAAPSADSNDRRRQVRSGLEPLAQRYREAHRCRSTAPRFAVRSNAQRHGERAEQQRRGRHPHGDELSNSSGRMHPAVEQTASPRETEAGNRPLTKGEGHGRR